MCGRGAWKIDLRGMGKNGEINEEKYSRIKTEGRRTIIRALGNCRTGQERKDEREIKLVLKQSRKTRGNVDAHENIKKSRKRVEGRKMKKIKQNKW